MAIDDVKKAKGHLEALLAIFAERYSLREPYDSAGALAIQAAIDAGAGADLAGLRAVLGGYNLYPHHENLAFAELRGAEEALDATPPATAAVARGKPLNQQNKTELLATAASRGVEVPEGATVAQLREALASVGFAEEETEAETEPEVEADPESPIPGIVETFDTPDDDKDEDEEESE